jgi:hypothetical protein
MVGNWIVWKIGDGSRVRVGEDPWLGVGDNFRLLEPLHQLLRIQNVITLRDASVGNPQPRGWEGWKDATLRWGSPRL